MEKESKLSQAFQSISDKVQDQVWFQQAKAKWDELDARSKRAVKYFLLIGGSVGGIALVGSSLYSVSAQKTEIDDKLALVQKIQGAQDELRRLKDITSRFNGTDATPWGQFLQDKAQVAGFDPSVISVTSEKIVISAQTPAGKKDPKSKDSAVAEAVVPEESVIEASLKKINVRQLVKYVHEVENGGRTVKVRRLQVDTNPDESGYLDATIIVSAFRLK